MPISMLCYQCGSPAERCGQCGNALCKRRLCMELHEASCAGMTRLPSLPSDQSGGGNGNPGQQARPGQPDAAGPEGQPGQHHAGGRRGEHGAGGPADPRLDIDFPATPPRSGASRRQRPERDVTTERLIVEQLVARITQHRQAGREALVAGELDLAFDELWAARQLEPDLDRFGAVAREGMPRDWELETDLVPLARALSARMHPRAVEAWCHVLDDAPARSIQAEAAEWLARHAFGAGQPRRGLRRLHAASILGRGLDAPAFPTAYRQAGLDPVAAFNLYLTATRLDPRSARAAGLRDPLTGELWADQDARWWLDDEPWHSGISEPSDPQLEAFHRASDLAQSKRDHGWLLLAEGDYLAGPLGARTLGRNLRTGCAEPADQDTFIRIRLAYESAADRLPDVAWPWYRLAELLAWAGFAERAAEHLAQAERRSVGPREAERTQRPLLRALVQAGLGSGPDGLPIAARPFPAEPFGVSLAARFRLR